MTSIHLKVGSTSIELSNAKTKPSREAISKKIYILGEKVYKILDKAKSYKIKNDFNNVNNNFGLPTTYLNIFDGTFSVDGNTSGKEVTIIEMKYMPGDNVFFQLSKESGFVKLKKYISSTNDRVQLKRILRAFQAAKKSNLSDAQGFITKKLYPILFTDIHCSTHQDSRFTDLINSVNKKLMALSDAGT